MLDRASTYADPEIVRLLKTRFVPVAIDQAYQRRQQDTEGEFYRKIAGQSPRNDFDNTTQGLYIATASGKLLLYNNNRDVPKVRRLIQEALEQFESGQAGEKFAKPIEAETTDKRWNVSPPDGGLVLRVQAKILEGYEATEDRWRSIFQTAQSRDNLWITAEEHRQIAAGTIPPAVQRRIARYHLVDNTRGEPPMWRNNEIREIEMVIRDGQFSGKVKLETDDRSRGYEAELRGTIESDGERVTRWDFVASGLFWGEGSFTRGAPKGKFPLAIAFTLADGTDIADRIPPQASRGWIDGYFRVE